MTKLSGSDSKSTLYCSFCGKSQTEVKKLIAGYDLQVQGQLSSGYFLYRLQNTTGDLVEEDLEHLVADLKQALEAATPADARVVERCFNVLMTPELRTCYDNLLTDGEAPPVFPNSGFGRLLVAGDLGSDGQTFFARQILSFAPSHGKLRLSVPFRRLAFLPDRAFYRDSRRRCEVVLDPVLLGMNWDQTWNTWKHLVPGRIDVNASFVETGQYRCRSGQWELITSLTALPSRVQVSVPAEIADDNKRQAALRSLDYMGLKGGEKITDIKLDRVFIGSCTNARIEDLREVARVVRDKRVNGNVSAMIVPGSGLVKEQAEAEGLDKIFKAAGFDWREPGCSMCLAMNPDKLKPGERCASTSNRNFEGRQGYKGRTHLVSPAMAAAAAIAGHFVDVREWK